MYCSEQNTDNDDVIFSDLKQQTNSCCLSLSFSSTGKNGIDLIADIKLKAPDVLCMICSFYDDDEFVFKALKNGACGYILKDAMPQEILESLKELHEGGAPMSPFIARKVIGTFQQKEEKQKLAGLTK